MPQEERNCSNEAVADLANWLRVGRAVPMGEARRVPACFSTGRNPTEDPFAAQVLMIHPKVPSRAAVQYSSCKSGF